MRRYNKAYPYIAFVYNMSYSVALYSLLLFYLVRWCKLKPVESACDDVSFYDDVALMTCHTVAWHLTVCSQRTGVYQCVPAYTPILVLPPMTWHTIYDVACSALETIMINCLQVLLSISSYAPTAWARTTC